MNKKTIRIAGWALGLSMAVAGIGALVGTSLATNNEPMMVKADPEPTEGTVTFAPTSTSAASQSGTYPSGATVEFANTYSTKDQMTSGKSQTWTFKGYSGKKITSLTAQFKRNSAKGTGTVSLTNNGSSVTVVKSSYARADLTASYNGYSIAKSEFVCAGDIVFTVAATENSLYCNQVVLEWEDNVTYVADSLTLSPSSSLVIDGNNAVSTKTGTITYEVGYAGDAGDGLVDVSITKDDSATTGLTYSDNGTGTITLTGREEGDYVVTVSTRDNDEGGDPISHDVAVTVQNLLEPSYPERVTSTTNLSIGDTVYFVNETNNVAAGAISGTYLTAKDVTISANKITDAGDAIGLTLGRDGSHYTFRDGSDYLATGAAKSINLSSSGTKTWDISFSSNNVEIESTTASYGQIYYNTGSPRFLNYTSSQAAIQLYVISATDAEVAAEFENTYLVMDKNVSGQCNTYYANAKTTFATLTSDQIGELSDAAINRLSAWAAAKGDTFNVATRAFAAASVAPMGYATSSENNLPLIITIISIGAAASVGLFFVQRKRRSED